MCQKVCALLISPEKFQQNACNGSCNSGSHGPTGKTVSAILKPSNALYSRSGTIINYVSASDEISQESRTDENGMSGVTHTNTATSLTPDNPKLS